MMIKKNLLLLIIGMTSKIANSYASSPWSFLNQNESETPALVCGGDDTAWYEKSGADAVVIPKVESETLYLQANSVNGQNRATHIAQGNVVAYKGNQTMTSDWLIYDQPSSRITAGDNMLLTRQYDAIEGNWADYYFNTQKGTFTQARIYYAKEDMSATGQQINLLDKNHLSVDHGSFTTCDPNDPDWYIRSDTTNFDYQNSQGTARNATMYFESMPIFTTPYMSFPLGERRSGWLTPLFGGSSNSGAMVGTPYYWNMAPNYDMTITPEVWANQGLMITDQFRYMSDSGNGSIYTEQMPSSWDNNTYRYYWSLSDTHNPLQNLQVGYKYNAVSDNNYFNDFGNFYSATDNVNLEQSAFVSYKPTWGLASAKLQNFQTLFPYGSSQTVAIYSSYPALNFNVNPQDLGGGFKGGFTSQYTNFFSPSMQSGQRSIFYPSITYPLQSAWGFVTPKFGYNYTSYDLGVNPSIPNTAGTIERALPITSLDSGLYFDRPLGTGVGSSSSLTQTFEPRIYYLYIPQQNQADIPLFDTATATYNYNQLFNENRFSGFDRINSANDVTIGGTTRLINDSNGSELMNLSVGYRYFITPENNFLYGNTVQDSQLFLPAPNAIAELTNNWSKSISTNASFQYDTLYNNIDAYGVNLKYNPDNGKVINLGYRYQYQLPLLYYTWTPGQAYSATYENQYALNISGQWPIYQNKLFAIGRTNYDFTLQQFLNVIGGLEYNAGCYSVSAVYENYIFNVNQSNTTYFLQFSFKGIGGVGTGDPTNDMNINVPGYIPINQLH